MQVLLAHRPVLPGLLLIYAVDPTHIVCEHPKMGIRGRRRAIKYYCWSFAVVVI